MFRIFKLKKVNTLGREAEKEYPPKPIPINEKYCVQKFIINMRKYTQDTPDEIIEEQAAELEKIFRVISTVDLIDKTPLIFNVYERISKRYNSLPFTLYSIYLLGFIFGIREERLRRRRKSAHN